MTFGNVTLRILLTRRPASWRRGAVLGVLHVYTFCVPAYHRRPAGQGGTGPGARTLLMCRCRERNSRIVFHQLLFMKEDEHDAARGNGMATARAAIRSASPGRQKISAAHLHRPIFLAIDGHRSGSLAADTGE
jgi:hypothetical protein